MLRQTPAEPPRDAQLGGLAPPLLMSESGTQKPPVHAANAELADARRYAPPCEGAAFSAHMMYT